MPELIIPNAALPDTRPAPLRERDYQAEEILTAAVEPFKNPKPTQLIATLYSQEQVGSCVPHGFLTQLELEGILPPEKCSQLRAYRKRGNYPQAGSQAVDMYDQIRGGQRPHADFPTPPGFNDAQANAMPLIVGDKLIKEFNYYGFSDYSLVPMAVAAGKAIAVFIYATHEEWAQEYVEIKNPNLDVGEAYVRHCVCIPQKWDFTENGKKWLGVHDSAAFGGRHLRYMSLDFFLKRAYYASQVYAKGTLPTPPAPPTPEKPTKVCTLGDRGDHVRALQAFLVKDGKLAPEYVTGYYGALTAKAVLWWQLEHWDRFSANVPMLLEWGGKYWGQQSIAIINA